MIILDICSIEYNWICLKGILLICLLKRPLEKMFLNELKCDDDDDFSKVVVNGFYDKKKKANILKCLEIRMVHLT